jgi:pilus assembly protein CpaE
MKDVLRIAIVDPSDSSRETLRNMLLGVESVWLEADCTRYEFFLDVLQQSIPDVAVVSLDADSTKALQLIADIGAQCPNVPILAVSGKNDGQCILQALRNGAKEFLTAPVNLQELLTALKRLGSATRATVGDSGSIANTAKTQSMVIAVLGSRGGVGCTSIAVNLGCTLAQEPGLNVALIDLDLALGDSDVALDLMPDYTLSDVALNVDRLDMTFLRRSLCQHATGLSLLPHPVQVEDAALIQEDQLQRVIGLLRTSYTHLILDLSKAMTKTDFAAMNAADLILLIGQQELSSLRNIVRMLMSFNGNPALADRVRIVLNQAGADRDISLVKAEETIGKPIFWQIPIDARAMSESRNAGVPLLQHAPKSKVQQSIQGLADLLLNKEVDQPNQKKERRKLFSFM